MTRVLRSVNHRTWWLLAIATLAALFVRMDGVDAVAGCATLALAWFKGRLVILDFMELRHAPTAWRAVAEGWLLLVTAVVLGVHLSS